MANAYGSSITSRVSAPPYTNGKMFVTYDGLINYVRWVATLIGQLSGTMEKVCTKYEYLY